MPLVIERVYVLKLDGASWTVGDKELEPTDHGPFVVLRPWSPGLCKLLSKQRSIKLPKYPAKSSLSQSDVYLSLVGSRNDASKEQQSKRQAEKLKEQSSGLFGGEASEAALVSVTGSSPRKAAKSRLSRRASREARAEKNVLKVAWMEKEIRVLEAGHVTDVPKVHLDDMALFFEATENAVLTAESFETRARQSFPKGTASQDKVVKIGQGRQAQRTGDDRRYSLVKKAGAKARPLDPLPLQEAEATAAAKRAAKSQGQSSKRRKPGVLVN
ncbi:unnamed protein product [Symbiodinium sp. CCMP2592]|nr:unnamed protein product [Symbiodinium sp. CCMP2592]